MSINSYKSYLTHSVIALALCGAATSPSLAQQGDIADPYKTPENPLAADLYRSRMQQVREIERAFAELETRRLSGDCVKHRGGLLGLRDLLTKVESNPGFTTEARKDLVARLEEAGARPCPPNSAPEEAKPAQQVTPPTAPPIANPPVEGGRTSNGAPPAPQPAPGQTRTLNDLIREYREQCGANGTRERLLIGLDRAIGQETDANRLKIRKGQRDRVAAGGKTEACPPDAPASERVGQLSPPTSERAESRSAYDAELDQIERFLNNGVRSEARRLIEALKIRQITNMHWFNSEQQARLEAAELDAFSGDFADAVVQRAFEDSRNDDAQQRKNIAIFNLLFNQANIPQSGIGVRRDGAPGAAPEIFAGETAKRTNGFGLSAAFRFGFSDNYYFHGGLGYINGDSSTKYSVPASSAAQRIDSGAVFGRLSNGSSGIIAPFGVSGRALTDGEFYSLDAGIGMSAAEIFAESQGFRIEVGVEAARSRREHELTLESSGVSGTSTFSFGQTRNQELEEDFVEFHGGLRFEIPVTKETDGGVTFGGKIRIGVYDRDTDFEGTERITANFGPNRDVTLNFSDEDGGLGAHFKADAGFTFHLDNGISVTLKGGIDHWTEVGEIVSPDSGDEVFFGGQTTRLERDDRTELRGGVALNFSF